MKRLRGKSEEYAYATPNRGWKSQAQTSHTLEEAKRNHKFTDPTSNVQYICMRTMK